jgi:hypothetical protein
MKYGVVGTHVNLASRIQSCTTGGQVLVSEATRREVPTLKIGRHMEICSKGFEQPVTVSEVIGIGGPHKLSLIQSREPLVALAEEIPVRCWIAEGSHLNGGMFKGNLTKMSPKRAEVRLETPVPIFSNLKMAFACADGRQVDGSLYCKVVSVVPDSDKKFAVHFTSMMPAVEALIRTALEDQAAAPRADRERLSASGRGRRRRLFEESQCGATRSARTRRTARQRRSPYGDVKGFVSGREGSAFAAFCFRVKTAKAPPVGREGRAASPSFAHRCAGWRHKGKRQ